MNFDAACDTVLLPLFELEDDLPVALLCAVSLFLVDLDRPGELFNTWLTLGQRLPEFCFFDRRSCEASGLKVPAGTFDILGLVDRLTQCCACGCSCGRS